MKMFEMMKRNSKRIFWIVTAALLFSGTGCGSQKERDPLEEQVMELTITSIPSPTPEPEQINPDAVVTTGGITMINEYTGNQENDDTE